MIGFTSQKYVLLILGCTVALCGYAQRQSVHPVIGKEVPDFNIRNMENTPDSVLTKNDLRGKFVILDFWNRSCSACVGYFPALDTLHDQFKDQVTIILIGTEDKQERMRPIYEKVRVKLRMTVPFAFDSVLYDTFVPGIVPHLVWIDDHGIVRAITAASDLNAVNIRSFLNGKPFPYYDWSVDAIESRQAWKLDINKPFLHEGNGGHGDELISRSLLVPYQPDRMAFTGLPASIDRVVNFYPNRGLVQGCAGLEKLYRFAFTGYPSWFYDDPVYKEFYPRCVLDVKDKSAFETDRSFGGLYWYSLSLPEKTVSVESLLNAMQNDLARSFGFAATVEKRKVQCWVVTSTRHARRTLKASGRKKDNDHIDPTEVIMSGTSMDKFIASVFYKHIENQQPIFNKTGIEQNFDVDLSVNVYDFDDIRMVLKSIGLNLKEKKRKMNVIVISDPGK